MSAAVKAYLEVIAGGAGVALLPTGAYERAGR
jgi:hypothetical protein